ncbi:Sec-independent protein translocase protein TatB [Psychrosphaera sp. 1_MG-2023]|uniref:Sec-independent protein translocase protein TatB n=1 Tax=Psychrosphaera sp. 1_MG-2023 TaxID=3062643 RepID=UPI0026E2234C|nr:Sec-independent protein translocase protein TatB [Psychrosphaera sp. 1_MG-2023]MDO6720801.1 Sec-independent protein translocase protein TatB [Psychrosphaera sp. 1_MG-2023]
MGFWELILIAVVGTIVLGPDRLPAAMRKVVQFKRQLSQMTQSFSAEVNEQLRVHELHENLKKAEQQGLDSLSPELQKSVDELTKAAESVNQPLNVEHQKDKSDDNRKD